MAAVVRITCRRAWTRFGPVAKRLWDRVWPATKEAVIDEGVQAFEDYAVDQLADAFGKAGEGLKALLTKPPAATSTKTELLFEPPPTCIDFAPPAPPILHRVMHVDIIANTTPPATTTEETGEVDVIFCLLLAYNLLLLSLVCYLIWRGNGGRGRDDDDDDE